MSKADCNRRYREKHAEQIAKGKAKWRAENAEHVKKHSKAYHIKNKDKISARMKEYTKNNPEGNRERSSRYDANKSQRCPVWADLNKIKNMYNECPKNMQVDHIIPLRGTAVSGLHVAGNLQYLSPLENQRKSNNY